MKRVIVERLVNGDNRYVVDVTTSPFKLHMVPQIDRARNYDAKTASDFTKFLNKRFHNRTFEVAEVEE